MGEKENNNHGAKPQKVKKLKRLFHERYFFGLFQTV